MEERRSDRQRSGRREEAGSRPSAEEDHGEAGRSGRRADRRSSHRAVVAASDGGSRHDAGCSHGAGHGGRSSRSRLVGRSRSRDHRGSPESANGSGSHEDAGSQTEAATC